MAEPAARELLDIARATDDIEGQVQARTALGWVMQLRDTDATTIRRNYEEAVDAAQRSKFLLGIVAASIDRGQFEVSIGNFDGAIEFFDRVIAILPSDPPEMFIAFCIASRARALFLRGDVEHGHEGALLAWRMAETLNVPRLRALAGTVLGITSFHLGEKKRGLELIAAAVQARRDIGNVPGMADALCQYAEALLACDRANEALAVLDELEKLFAAHPNTFELEVEICNLLVRGSELRGDTAAASAHRARSKKLVARKLQQLPDESDRQRYLRRFDTLWAAPRR